MPQLSMIKMKFPEMYSQKRAGDIQKIILKIFQKSLQIFQKNETFIEYQSKETSRKYQLPPKK